MKKNTLYYLILFTLSAVMSLISFRSTAQRLHIGIKGGANFDRPNSGDYRGLGHLSYHIGGFVGVPLTGVLGIQPEVLFHPSRNRSTPHNLSIPVLLKISASDFFVLNVGPQFSVPINRHISALQNMGNAFSRGDLAMVFGAQLGSGPLKLYARYTIGLTNISNLPYQDEWKSRQIQVGFSLNVF